jgi:signal transduction histidine kinase
VQRFAPKLVASLDRAIAFCNDTLRFGKAAEQPPRRELFYVGDLVADVADELSLPRGEQIRFRQQIPDELQLDADPDQLFRVLTNLVRNAVQALEGPGDGRGEVSVEAGREGTSVWVKVSDDGPGVPAKAREHLFHAFQGSVRKGGTGLGLAIAHELVAANGGTLELAPATKGAAFVIRILDREA